MHAMVGIDKLSKNIETSLGKFKYFSLAELAGDGHNIEELPFSIRILLENIIRNFDGVSINETHLDNILNWNLKLAFKEIPYLPARVLMQDFTGAVSYTHLTLPTKRI